ncbi:MAG TPA: heme-binding protein [Tabrizicola sp.]|nr:heme-binding protein [Tabrizicola sp.]
MLKRIILALGITMAGQAEAEDTHKGYEMPPFKVEWQDGVREIRTYGPHLLAEVRVSGGRSGAIQKGFRILAGYIFGGNATGEKIAMTVPVAQTPEAGGETWVVSFMMPAAYTTDTLPAPRSDAIRFVQVDASRQLVERFSGLPETSDLADRAEALRLWAEAQGYEILAGPHYYFYDAPMTLPWKRRNEVAFPIR